MKSPPFRMTPEFVREARRFLREHNAEHDTLRIRTDDPNSVFWLDASATRNRDDYGIAAGGIQIVVGRSDAKRIAGGTLGMLQTLREYRLSFEPAVGSVATNAGRLELSPRRLKQVQPELGGVSGLRVRWNDWRFRTARFAGTFDYVRNHLQVGDSRAALALIVGKSTVVAAYTSDLDCVAVLEFPGFIGRRYGLSEGSRLISVNTYTKDERGVDLVRGPRATDVWSNFHPIIGEFVSSDSQRLRELRETIDEDEWERAWNMGIDFLEKCVEEGSMLLRDGAPLDAGDPAIAAP